MDFDCIILAAGKGKRMGTVRPKVLHSFLNKTLLVRTLEAVSPAESNAALKLRKIFLVVGYGQDQVRCALAEAQAGNNLISKIKIELIEQVTQGGTGHAVQTVLAQVKDLAAQVAIIPCDLPLINAHALKALTQSIPTPKTPVRLLTTTVENPYGYGRIIRDSSQKVVAIREEKDATAEERKISEINPSLYFFNTNFLAQHLRELKTTNAQQELYLTDVVGLANNHHYTVEAEHYPESQVLSGVNTITELAILEKELRLKIIKKHMDAGVSFEDPEATYVDENVVIGSDTYLGSGTRLRANTKIGTNCRIEGNSIITNSTIGDNCQIKLACLLDSATLDTNVSVGPFAHLRPGTQLARDVHIGNFVEVKKSTLGVGSKANHLTYLGDATIGAAVNVGAGTITCNYDGTAKHQTTIADGAFIGSNTSLVAPVTLGAGSITGAGSVITKDVPADALAIERTPQKNLADWARQKRTKKS
ncbi:bifunctional UDP-N-acetylglucosamine diphosphorylase/glucosamine-1-phosphate N-acetyltransferase GlmU [bacterium]|nr:bifunctional UDP-N-acetylglucosamine diphosphorylase/glucosamine-1-phosphate N-acetyltransferase GlmU [bacterium]